MKQIELAPRLRKQLLLAQSGCGCYNCKRGRIRTLKHLRKLAYWLGSGDAIDFLYARTFRRNKRKMVKNFFTSTGLWKVLKKRAKRHKG